MTEFSAEQLKKVLWASLADVRGSKISIPRGNSVAYHARELIRTVNTELRAIEMAGKIPGSRLSKQLGVDEAESQT